MHVFYFPMEVGALINCDTHSTVYAWGKKKKKLSAWGCFYFIIGFWYQIQFAMAGLGLSVSLYGQAPKTSSENFRSNLRSIAAVGLQIN